MPFESPKWKIVTKFFICASLIPVWDMVVSTTMVGIAFFGVFLSSETRNLAYMFPQYSMKFHLMYRLTATKTQYFFPGATKYFVIWFFWLFICCMFGLLTRRSKPLFIFVLSVLCAVLIKVVVFVLVVNSGYVIPLDGF